MSASLRNVALALLVVVACNSAAGGPSPHASSTPSREVATTFRPFMGAPEIPQPGWMKATAGTTNSTCVSIGAAELHRSGDFASSLGGAFAKDWRMHPGHAKVGWIPRDPTGGPLHIHGDNLGGGTYDDDLGFAASYASGTGYFWPDTPSFRQPGHWTFELIAGGEWGCFVIDL